MKFKKLDPQAIGQWVACDTLPQALWHNLMMGALLKNGDTQINKENTQIDQNPLHKAGDAGSNEPDPVHSNPFPILSCKCFHS